MPARTFSSVDLPEPFGPTIPTVSPGATVNETSVRAGIASSGASARPGRPDSSADLNVPIERFFPQRR